MEHVTDDKKAIDEIYRILKKGGVAFISVPIDINSNNTIDDKCDSDKERLEKYGQIDHVRLYGNDIKEKFEKSGFKVVKHVASNEINKEEREKIRIMSNDIVFELKK